MLLIFLGAIERHAIGNIITRHNVECVCFQVEKMGTKEKNMEHRVAFFQGMTRILLTIGKKKQDIYIIYIMLMIIDIFITATRYISVHIHINKNYIY